MPLDKVIGSIKAGVGGTLGSLALIMGFAQCWAKCWQTGGGAQRIATTLIAKFGKTHPVGGGTDRFYRWFCPVL